jgi:hypothetical protein
LGDGAGLEAAAQKVVDAVIANRNFHVNHHGAAANKCWEWM